MTVLADYSAEEQTVLLRSLSAAAVAISAASLGRKTETVQEGFAAAQYIIEVREPYLTWPLVGSVQYELERRAAADQPFPDFVAQATAPGAEQAALEMLRAAAAVLDAKAAPQEAAGYKQWLLDIAATTKNAGKEGGGWFGRGAVAVNDEERSAYARIAQALGVAAG